MPKLHTNVAIPLTSKAHYGSADGKFICKCVCDLNCVTCTNPTMSFNTIMDFPLQRGNETLLPIRTPIRVLKVHGAYFTARIDELALRATSRTLSVPRAVQNAEI